MQGIEIAIERLCQTDRSGKQTFLSSDFTSVNGTQLLYITLRTARGRPIKLDIRNCRTVEQFIFAAVITLGPPFENAFLDELVLMTSLDANETIDPKCSVSDLLQRFPSSGLFHLHIKRKVCVPSVCGWFEFY